MQIKKITLFVSCLFVILNFTNFISKPTSHQNNYWPTIKGKWYFSYEASKDFVTVFHRTGNRRGMIDFITKDSCLFPNGSKHLTGDGPNLSNFNWRVTNDTISFLSKKDTLIVKVIYLTSSEFRFKPIYPLE